MACANPVPRLPVNTNDPASGRDVSLLLLQERLALLESQRSLAALRAQEFQDYLQGALLNLQPSPPASAAASFGSSDSDGEEAKDVWGDVMRRPRHGPRGSRGKRCSLDSRVPEVTSAPSQCSTRRQSADLHRLTSHCEPAQTVGYSLSRSEGSSLERRSLDGAHHAPLRRSHRSSLDIDQESVQYYSRTRSSRRASGEPGASGVPAGTPESHRRRSLELRRDCAAVESSGSLGQAASGTFTYTGLGAPQRPQAASAGPGPCTVRVTVQQQCRAPATTAVAQQPSPALVAEPRSDADDVDTSEASDAEVFLRGGTPRHTLQGGAMGSALGQPAQLKTQTMRTALRRLFLK